MKLLYSSAVRPIAHASGALQQPRRLQRWSAAPQTLILDNAYFAYLEVSTSDLSRTYSEFVTCTHRGVGRWKDSE
jgi:hypothetical protein